MSKKSNVREATMTEISLSPFQRRDNTLAGLVINGRWPDDMREWVHVMLVVTRLATVPGLLMGSEIFKAVAQLPDNPRPEAVGVIIDEGPAVSTGEELIDVEAALPNALMVLHPPNACTHSPGFRDTARGIVLLPGLPHVGMPHQAAWVEVEPDGTVAHLSTRLVADEVDDPDVAVLTLLLTA